MKNHKIYSMPFANVYPYYVAKAEKKGRTKQEVDQILFWLMGYTKKELNEHLNNETNFESFIKHAPKLNPKRLLIKGVICGVRIEEMEDSLMREIRFLDKLIDELAKGKTLEKIFRE
ncbi:MAG TPA: DUF2200 domain-containing protein [Oligoflexia bacterium]|nr:DUF2200 domain-containing protein [Oligoflexia bacterium]HMR24279.1 DUF2200 domain-containing protein [Oligoflexia bacterium]